MKNNHTSDLNAVRDQIIMAALPHVIFDGWSDKSLLLAANELSLDATIIQRLFGGGPLDAVIYFIQMADRMMLEDAAGLDFGKMGDKGRLIAVFKLRFDRWSLHREAIRRALGVLALPHHLVTSAKLTWGTADALWLAIGKRSHDFSWYTRRASLSPVLAATFLVWLDDQSENFAETYAFLARSLDQVGQAIKLRRQAWTWVVDQVPALSQWI